MVCLGNMCVDALRKGDNDNNDDDFTLSNDTILTDVGSNVMSIYSNPQAKLYTTALLWPRITLILY